MTSGKENNAKRHPPTVYNGDCYSGYHLEDLEEIRAVQEPGALEMRQLGESFTTLIERKSCRPHLSAVEIAQSHVSHALLNGNSGSTHTCLVPFSI